MKRFILILSCFLIFPLYLKAETLNKTIPCNQGGTVTIQGDFSALTGALDVILKFDNCKNGDDEDTTQINGTASLSGVLQTIGGSIDVTITLNNVSFASSSSEESLSESLNETCSGTLKLKGSSSLDGKVSINRQSSFNCQGEGSLNTSFSNFVNSLIFLDIF